MKDLYGLIQYLGKLFVYYNDGNSSQWVETNPSLDLNDVVASVNGMAGDVIVGIDDLGDVTITNIQTNDILKWNGTGWVNSPAPSGTISVESVNGYTGTVVLDASDVGALPDTFTETDPLFTAWDKSTGISITESQISDLGSYLESETDPVFTASPSYGIASGDITNWNTAHGWGDHSLAGYLTSASNLDATKLTGTISSANLPSL